MKLSAFKEQLQSIKDLQFQLNNGLRVPAHFHVTEVGITTKNFIDCGGTVREEKKANFQLWYDNDVNHRLDAKKLLDIIAISEKNFDMDNLDIEVEYQSDTVGRYQLEFKNGVFVLVPTQTDCLAKDKCGIPEPQKPEPSQCAPGSGCC